jgi:hypothetical protein
VVVDLFIFVLWSRNILFVTSGGADEPIDAMSVEQRWMNYVPRNSVQPGAALGSYQ